MAAKPKKASERLRFLRLRKTPALEAHVSFTFVFVSTKTRNGNGNIVGQPVRMVKSAQSHGIPGLLHKTIEQAKELCTVRCQGMER